MSVKLLAFLVCGWLFVLLAGCATPATRGVSVSDSAIREETERQKDLAVQKIAEEQERLARVYRVLATKAHRMCGKDLTSSTGAIFRSTSRNELSPAYARLYGITDRPTLLFVLDGSPAKAAGLQARDVITHVNDTPVPRMDDLSEALKSLRASEPVRMRMVRNGTTLDFEFKPEPACAYSAVLHPDLVPNAYADGTRIVVTRGMMAFARDDFELSLVLAHELAHNAMHHMDAKKQNMVGDFFTHMLAAMSPGGPAWTSIFSTSGTFSYSQEFEAEADYVGSYIIAAAGLPFGDATAFWRRMAASNPSNIDTNTASSHRSIPQRMLALEATIREIRDKIEHGQALEPNMREGRTDLSLR